MHKLLMPVLTLPLLVACQPEEGRCESAAEFVPSLALGTTEDAFEPVQDHDEVLVEYGNQGGTHLWVSLAASGIVPGYKLPLKPAEDAPEVYLSMSLADGELIDDDLVWPQAWKGNSEYSELLGLRLHPHYFEGVEDMEEVVVDLRAEVSDICGTELVDERRVTVMNWQAW